jgi:molecular chaperone GrpE
MSSEQQHSQPEPEPEATVEETVATATGSDASAPADADAGDGGDAGDGVHAVEDEPEQELDELAARAARSDEYLALAQRTQADFENFRKRMTRDVAAAEARGIGRLAKELLPALDNLGRALQAAEAPGEAGSGAPEHHLTSGIRLVHDELVAALGRVGIEGFWPQGELFDPQQHEAMLQQPVEGVASGTVVEVYQSGYRLGGVVLRPARVVVAA